MQCDLIGVWRWKSARAASDPAACMHNGPILAY
jgi:hypothetical protein